ncbi:MAG: transketolase [Patescibacteria group bacterium]
MKFLFTEAATGSLGQGLSVGVGMALAQKNLDKTSARTYVLLGDSEMAEGQVWEAMSLASHYELGNLVAIVDVNRLGQRGETMLGHDIDAYAKRANSFGWRTIVVDGHDTETIKSVYENMIGDYTKPLMIIAKTYKGRGISFLEDKYSWHGKVLNKQEFGEATQELGEVDFQVRAEVSPPGKGVMQFRKVLEGSYNNALAIKKAATIDKEGKYATRDAYGNFLIEKMFEDERVVVLDAETSNSTRAQKAMEFFPERFFEMFIAEQNMVSVAVGFSRMGYKPFCSTFAAFLTRAHDQIRMARLSESNITFVGSHGGVSIGADGGSQMGLSDIAMMRGVLDGVVLYPSDVVSARKLMQTCSDGINYVRTTREKNVVLYGDDDKFVIGGSNVLRESEEDEIVVIASGITVFEALKAHEVMKIRDINIRVIDLYSVKPIDKDMLLDNIGFLSNIIVVEDHYLEGGVCEAVRSVLFDVRANVHSLAVGKMPRSGTCKELLAYEKIDFDAIIKKIEQIIK